MSTATRIRPAKRTARRRLGPLVPRMDVPPRETRFMVADLRARAARVDERSPAGGAVAVPHAALAALVELASGTSSEAIVEHHVGLPPLSALYDVAMLARRYGRAPATVRQWFADGLFGPSEERRFRGRGYVAPAEVVAAFEARTGLRSGGGVALDLAVPEYETRAAAAPAEPAARAKIGGKIRAAGQRSTAPRLTPAAATRVRWFDRGNALGGQLPIGGTIRG
jgi:hypothetical protein